MFKLIILVSIFCLSCSASAKPDCQYYLNKLKKVQSQLRAGYTVGQGEKLKKKEKQARNLWWLCSKNKLPKAELKRLKQRQNSKKH
ncbi:hypothetical protein [Thalassotalea sp. ND16A]|uniref:hypothetical protein n=1 Tax=Thalassotalea sp. ND16A TaxID=1535422 RepID=UPI00051A30F5|nr:hypothetical protein [Thalassotalea sp. ND16A]KGJ89229.1 hypothetical protein ND16A_2122 [Thalassotalea sp. ND16A]